MEQPADRLALVDQIEAVIHADVGRNITALFTASRGGLRGAVAALASAAAPRVGLLTGFYVPSGVPPAAETDGPAGAALLAVGLTRIGIPCRLATDAPCRAACEAALAGAGAHTVPVDVVALGEPLDRVIDLWRHAGITHGLSIERCGCSADGTPKNMRGLDIGSYTAPLDALFLAGPWDTIAIGDGGNEIGMGSLPAGLIAQHVRHGAEIVCVTPAAHLIVAGVSHWGSYALLGGLAAMRDAWRVPLRDCLDETLDQAILEATVYQGPAVDGVSLQQAMTIDTLDLAAHHRVLREIRTLLV